MKSIKSILISFLFISSIVFCGDGVFDSVKWKFATGDRIYSSPAIVNGTIYFGSNDGNLYAVNLDDGSELWKFKTDGDIRSGVTISDEKIYFGSTDGYYYALNSDNGSLVWKFATGGENEYDVWDYYMSTPLIYNDKVYFGSGDSTFYSLNKNSGELIWSYKTKGINHSSSAMKNDVLYFGSFDGHLYALNAETGAEKWKFNTLGNASFPDGAVQGSPLIFQNNVILGSRDYNLYALNTEDGSVMWNKSSPSWIIAKPVADTNGFLFFGNSENPHIYAKHYKYGTEIWDFKVSANVFSNAVLFNDDVLFGSFGGKIYVMSRQSGELKYTIQTDASKEKYSTIFNEEDEIKKEILSNIKTMDDVKKVYDDLLDLGAVIGTPIIENDVLYVPAADGYLYAFE